MQNAGNSQRLLHEYSQQWPFLVEISLVGSFDKTIRVRMRNFLGKKNRLRKSFNNTFYMNIDFENSERIILDLLDEMIMKTLPKENKEKYVY